MIALSSKSERRHATASKKKKTLATQVRACFFSLARVVVRDIDLDDTEHGGWRRHDTTRHDDFLECDRTQMVLGEPCGMR